MGRGKCLVVYYSRTGTTRRVAEQIAQALGCEAAEVIDAKRRSGVLGFLKSVRDALAKKPTRIADMASDAGGYDLVVIGTPVWAGTMTPAIRTYIAEQKDRLPEVAFFLTTGGSGIEATFQRMEELCGKPPKATLGLKQKEVLKGDPAEAVRSFVQALQS